MKKSNLITVSAAVLLLSVQSAAAQVCTTPPTCDALGYTKTEADCSGKTILKCPLDQTKVYCPGYEETQRKYKVGDTYADANGIGIGTVVKIDSSGQHGVVVAGAYAGTVSEVNQHCMSKTAGGLEWGIVTKGMADLYKNITPGCEFFLTSAGCCHTCGTNTSNCYSSDSSNCSGGLCQANF